MVSARELGAFTAVGTTATGVNLGTVAALVPLGMAPLVANVVGFLLSLAWSFFGHSRWTFPAEGRDAGVALKRFTVVSVLSFSATEAAYAGALEWTNVDYRLSLFVIIVTLSGAKILASKYWAFARARAESRSALARHPSADGF